MSRTWFIEQNGKVIGPVTSAQLRQLAAASMIDEETKVRLEEGTEWVSARKVNGLFAQTTPPKVGTRTDSEVPPVPAKPVGVATGEVASSQLAPVVIANRFCPFCGKQTPITSMRCRQCDKSLEVQPKERPATPQQVIQYVPQPVHQPIIKQQSYQSNTVPCLLNLFVFPGVGQLIQGRLLAGILFIFFFILSLVSILFGVGFVLAPVAWLLIMYDAYHFKRK